MKVGLIEYRRVPYLGDDPAAFEYAQAAFRAMVQERVVPPRSGPSGSEAAILASYKGHAVALATYYPGAGAPGHSWLWLDLLYVEPEARNKGVARELVTRLRLDAGLLGATHVRFGVKLDNDAMLGLASRLGFASDSLNFVGHV